MRQTVKERRKQLHRGMPMSRLLTLVIMLAILGMIFSRLRDPNTWSWFARDNDDNPVATENEPAGGKNPPDTQPAVTAPSQEQAAAPTTGNTAATKESAAPPSELTPTGPTDLDPMEQEDIKTAISAISDGNLEMTALDMPAYFQILSWVDHQPTQLLQKRAKKDVLYNDFRKTPESIRLQIVELKLNVRQIVRLTKPPKDGIPNR